MVPNVEPAIKSEQPTLGELIDEKRFGLSLAVGGTSELRRPVLGAHTVEVEEPGRWLAPGWVMLTAGLRLQDKPEEQRGLIEELDEQGVAALGLSLGVCFEQIPAPLAEEARDRDFPVFAIPYSTRFRDIEAYVQRASLHKELRTGQRVLAAQRYLFDSLEYPEPVAELLRRLAALTQAKVWLLDAGGRCLCSTEGDPDPALWREISRRPDTVLTFDLQRVRHIAIPLQDEADDTHRWLVLSSAGIAFAEPFAKGSGEAAARLLGAINRLEDIHLRQEESAQSGLLDSLLDEDLSSTEAEILVRCAAAMSVEIEGSVVVVAETRERPSGELRQRFNATLRNWGIPALVAVRDERVAALLSSQGDSPTDLLQSLTDSERGLRIGIGSMVSDVGTVRRSFREAVLALETSASDGLHRMIPGGELDLIDLLLDGGSQDLIAQRSTELLRPIGEHDLLRTLATYFACDMNVGHAAFALDVHPNTVRHRLSRIEQLLGSPLQRPATVAALQVALRCSDLDY